MNSKWQLHCKCQCTKATPLSEGPALPTGSQEDIREWLLSTMGMASFRITNGGKHIFLIAWFCHAGKNGHRSYFCGAVGGQIESHSKTHQSSESNKGGNTSNEKHK